MSTRRVNCAGVLRLAVEEGDVDEVHESAVALGRCAQRLGAGARPDRLGVDRASDLDAGPEAADPVGHAAAFTGPPLVESRVGDAEHPRQYVGLCNRVGKNPVG